MFHIHLREKNKNHHSSHWYEQVHATHANKRVVHKQETHPYHRATLAESIHNACMKSFGFSGEAELTALKVCQHVEDWLESKEEVTKADIKRIAAAALRQYNPKAAYEYLPVKEYALRKDQYGFIRL